jgi:hypothetical protein
MKVLLRSLVVLGSAITLACSTMKTAVDYDHTLNWSQLHTFQLVDGTPSPETFTQKRIEDGITGTLTSKGWKQVTANPDVLVAAHVVLTSEKQVNATSTGGFGRMRGGMGQATVSNVPIGTIVVTMTDPKTNELIWRGTAQDQVTGGGSDRGQVQDAMKEIFKDFPPGSASK